MAKFKIDDVGYLKTWSNQMQCFIYVEVLIKRVGPRWVTYYYPEYNRLGVEATRNVKFSWDIMGQEYLSLSDYHKRENNGDREGYDKIRRMGSDYHETCVLNIPNYGKTLTEEDAQQMALAVAD